MKDVIVVKEGSHLVGKTEDEASAWSARCGQIVTGFENIQAGRVTVGTRILIKPIGS